MNLINDDCLIAMAKLPDKSIDFILTDLPYGTTQCKWDSVIPFEPMWIELKRIIKDNGCIALFGSEPFSSHLRLSNLAWFKYDWIWEKSMPSGMATSSFMPMKYHEIISVFVNRGKPTFNKQLAQRNKISLNRAKYKVQGSGNLSNHIALGKQPPTQYNPTKVNPKTVLKFKSVPNTPKGSKLHSTQKPTDLLEYLIKTYTNENETVLDFTMGSGSTGVACMNTNRDFIGIELNKDYFAIAKERIKKTTY